MAQGEAASSFCSCLTNSMNMSVMTCEISVMMLHDSVLFARPRHLVVLIVGVRRRRGGSRSFRGAGEHARPELQITQRMVIKVCE